MANSSKKSTSTASSTKKMNSNAQENNNMKYEIANELGVKLGADATARQNGQVGGEMTRRLVESAKTKKSTNCSSSK
mgnify:FL=1